MVRIARSSSGALPEILFNSLRSEFRWPNGKDYELHPRETPFERFKEGRVVDKTARNGNCAVFIYVLTSFRNG